MRAILPPWQKNYTSDDYTDYTWHCPTARLYVGRAMLASPKPGYQYPTWVWNALGGYPATIDPTIFSRGARDRRQPRRSADRPAGRRRRAGRVPRAHRRGHRRLANGSAPLLPKNFPAPIHYRWPEYVSTPRGEEWWLPQGA